MQSSPMVNFPSGETGSTLLRGALAQACERYPGVFAGLEVPSDSSRFKRALPELIGEFEVRRAASDERVDIAECLTRFVQSRAHWGDSGLSAGLGGAEAGDPIELRGTATPGWVPEIDYRGRTWRGAEIGGLADRLREDQQLTDAATEALRWVAAQLLQEPVDLTRHRFAILGAQAELSPTTYLLRAGATVLWVDRQAPALSADQFAGTVVHHPAALDLLTDTPAIAAAVARFASEGPAHLGLYAYAPGKGRELLLTTAMNAIAEHTGPASVAMLVSPTTPGEVQPDDRRDRASRRSAAPRWQRALARLRVLPEPAHHRHGEVEISRSIVPMQGPTYLAAQYLSKMMAAEAWAVRHAPMRVSANVAGITHTKSLEHPLFLAGFAGAPLFGIEIFQPEQTRVLTTLLLLHDLLNPDAPAADPSGGPRAQAGRVAAQSIHGGVRSAPFVLDQTIRVAAVLGLGKHPGLLLKLRR